MILDKTVYVLVPYKKYRRMLKLSQKARKDSDVTIPHEVVGFMVHNDDSAMKAWRRHLGLTQAQVAESLGITQAAYSQIENSKTSKKDTIQRVAAALGIDPEQLSVNL